MRSSDRNSGGNRNPRGGGSGRRDNTPRRSGTPRPEERRYDVGETGQSGSNRPGGVGGGKGAAKGGPSHQGPAARQTGCPRTTPA
ncbi:pseudouridine synthase, partial [Streptomyces sp. HSW2009]